MTDTAEPTGAASRGTIVIPEAGHRIEPTSTAALDEAVDTVADRLDSWVALGVRTRIGLVDAVIEDTLAVAEAWADAIEDALGVPEGSPQRGEGWLGGPVATLSFLRRLRETLQDIEETGRPQPPDIRTRPDGQVVVDTVPADALDRVFYPFFEGEVRVRRGVDRDEVEQRIGGIYRDGADDDGAVCLVLGAGNISAIPARDTLSKLFFRNRVCVLKMNPVNEYVGPILEQAFATLIDAGYLRIVYGGTAEGKHLTSHAGIDEIHMTGSDKTHDAIVFGTGDEGRRRKQQGDPKLDKPITSELGNVTPVIIVPGPWSESDLAFHGDNLATSLVLNAGFNCIASRVIVQHREWARRHDLLDAVRESLSEYGRRDPYYPGARDRWRSFVDAHPEKAETYGPEGENDVPWTLIPGVDPDQRDDVVFTTEVFAGVFAEVGLDAPRSVPDFIDQAVEFCNHQLWGTLAATIIVHPRSLQDPEVEAALERAIDRLDYGTVTINHWSALAYLLPTLAWGGAPGSPLEDIQSGRGWVHNTFLVPEVEKSVLRGPFRTPSKPWWFHTYETGEELGEPAARLYANDDWRVLPRIAWATIRA
ncbi:MAG: aldehyde dehydrogenase family protein [Nitriliruptorales bacterium]|nr:aldehyde dehydrogenase family protein [Nitriliruptorales bacterium]